MSTELNSQNGLHESRYKILNDGNRIPVLALGTWLGYDQGKRVVPKGDEIVRAVEWALDAGYRHIDTASVYGVEDQVGRGLANKIKDGTVKREDVFITTKLYNDRHQKDEVVPALRESLAKLALDYVDLYLIHWPTAYTFDGEIEDIDYLDTWKGMEEAKNLGLSRSIGLSNFNKSQLTRVLDNCQVKPAALQIEINLNCIQKSLSKLADRNGIVVLAYSPFGSLFGARYSSDAPPPRADDPTLVAIATKYNKTVPQIVLRYILDRGMIPLPKSLSKSRIEQNSDVFDFHLTPDEIDTLESYKAYRSIQQKKWISHPEYPFAKEI